VTEVITPKPTHILAISVGIGDWPVRIGVVDIKNSKAEDTTRFLGGSGDKLQVSQRGEHI
jgi:hypothetical protein